MYPAGRTIVTHFRITDGPAIQKDCPRANRPMNTDRTYWPGVAFGLALLVLAAYQQFKLPPSLPALLAQYDYSRLLAGGFMSVYAVCGLVLSVRLGALMQGRGMERFILAAFGLFIVAAGAMLVWPERGWLFLAARVAEGIGFAILAIAGAAICTASAGVRGLSLAAAAIATWIPLGGLVANMVSAAGGHIFGWQLLWWFGIGVTLLAAVWTYRMSRGGRLRLAATKGGGDAVAPSPQAETAAWRAMTLSAGLFMLWTTQMFAYFTWLPDFMVAAHGVNPRDATLLYTAPVAIIALFNLVAAPILRAGVPVAILLAAAAAVQAVVWFMLPVLNGLAAGVLSLVVYAMAAGLSPTCLFALPGTIFGVDRTGTRAFGYLMTGRNIGVLMGPVLIGLIVDRTGNWSLAPPILGASCTLLTLGALVLHNRLRRLASAGHGTSR